MAAAKDSRVMIYPTPMKQNASFGSPYSDLFREFQARIVRDQSVLVVVGYSFNDEHVNNLIYQALTIPTFRLVAALLLIWQGLTIQEFPIPSKTFRLFSLATSPIL